MAIEPSKKKATFNLDEDTYQGLKLTAAVQKREMVEVVEEALGMYLGWNKMTKIEKDELELYRIAERDGAGRAATADFIYVSNNLDAAPVLADLLDYLDGRYLVVQVNDNQTGFKPLKAIGKDFLLKYAASIKLQLTIPGRHRFEQLQAREQWENERENKGPQLLEAWRQKAAAFRSERIKALANAESFVPLEAGPKLVLHCIPLESFATDTQHDVFALGGVYPMYWSHLTAWGPRINIEGSICVAAGEPSPAYTQIYRNGAIEAVRVGVLSRHFLSHPSDASIIPSLTYEEAVVQYVLHCFQLMRQLGCIAPVLIGITLIGVKGMTLAGTNSKIDRDVLVLPEVLVEDLSARPSPLLKKALDWVWNACGSAGSPHFDASGNWIGQQQRTFV
jgi:hypothetical protein